MFDNLPKKYLIYMICCDITNKKYVGHTSNLTSRLEFTRVPTKTVVYVYVSRNIYKRQLDMKDYQMAYKKQYRKKTQYPLLNFSLRYFM